MTVSVGGLPDAGVTHLLLHTSDVRAALEQPGRVSVTQGVRLAVGELRRREERLPDVLKGINAREIGGEAELLAAIEPGLDEAADQLATAIDAWTSLALICAERPV